MQRECSLVFGLPARRCAIGRALLCPHAARSTARNRLVAAPRSLIKIVGSYRDGAKQNWSAGLRRQLGEEHAQIQRRMHEAKRTMDYGGARGGSNASRQTKPPSLSFRGSHLHITRHHSPPHQAIIAELDARSKHDAIKLDPTAAACPGCPLYCVYVVRVLRIVEIHSRTCRAAILLVHLARGLLWEMRVLRVQTWWGGGLQQTGRASGRELSRGGCRSFVCHPSFLHFRKREGSQGGEKGLFS